MWYMGKEFNKESNKEYKTLEGGLKAAQREGMNLYDENGEVVHPAKAADEATEGAGSEKEQKVENSTPEAEKGQEGANAEATGTKEEGVTLVDEDEATEGAGSEKEQKVENSTPEAEKGQEGANAEATGTKEEGVTLVDEDEVPEGALEDNEDGSVNVYDESGKKVGTISKEEAEEAAAAAGEAMEGSVTAVHGKIHRIFNGAVRIRRSPSWDMSAEAGVTKFEEKQVKALHIVDGKPMYETTDGYFITGADDIVEFIEE